MKILNLIVIFIIGMIGGIFADQILWPYFIERPLFHEYRLEQTPIYITEKKEIVIEENTALQEAIEKVEKTIVRVGLSGSGLVITSDGLIITLASLIPQGSDFQFFVDGKLCSYQVLKRNVNNNLALVKLDRSNLATTGFNKDVKLGERVFALGFEDASLAAREGIIGGINEDFIQTSIIEDSFWGSPLFNIRGEVVGLSTINDKGKIIAIPVSIIKEFIGF